MKDITISLLVLVVGILLAWVQSYILYDVWNHVLVGEVFMGVAITAVTHRLMFGALLMYRLFTIGSSGGETNFVPMACAWLFGWALAYIIV